MKSLLLFIASGLLLTATCFTYAYHSNENSSGATTSDPAKFVFAESNELITYNKDGQELWRFKVEIDSKAKWTDPGAFVNSSFGRAQVRVTEDFVLVSSVANVFAIDKKSGKQKWVHEFTRQTEISHIAQFVVAKDKVLLDVNQVGDHIRAVPLSERCCRTRHPARLPPARVCFRKSL